jgi:4,5-DOPA dioxygenase extradiol
MRREGAQGFDWAVRFNQRIREALATRDHRTLVDFEKLGEDARLSVPTPEHYLPLLYIAGLQGADESMAFPVDGYDLGSISMLTAVAGLPKT